MYNVLDDENNFKATHRTYSIHDVVAAEINLEPMECIFCHSLEVEYNQLLHDAYCADCGRWQLEEE